MDLLGDIGGVSNVLVTIFGVFLFKYTNHSYLMHAANKLFLLKESDSKIFSKKDD